MENPNQHKLFIESSILDSLPSVVRNELKTMNTQKQGEFVEEYKRKMKSTGIAYLLLIIVFALHYGYLKKWGLQIVFWLTAGGFMLWWFIDLFRTAGMVKDYNKEVAMEVMRNL